ncbi:hypothetical protein MJO28_012901 [Puccinia striiformis f. sp. tritici]|uniref:Uncharacterized protein n=4 Tax=Puccinia striiformis TaxID=27350 RepID=A0A0L0VMN6_9BASI|nr:hypothetical protein MJO28_012901 [Puccinia striiformis f. sp. tritici]KAI9629814.1 hypothetical protein KEM48_012570 [Puccinia striiformis f. sp. tritici PST-130]KNF00457.1 hypothetical protein PSTG_06388 [Puccinia striiformis f. sp. tritici PST-78]POV98752.1 hypothetical protein PSHT_13876 [Puccinia striiformis]KAI7943330.1 hypothetical protein MJO29_013174 [Puccinia striiformis f. sp. tritici]
MAKLVSPSLPFVIVHPPGYITGQPRPSDHQVHPAPATVAASWALADPLISHFPANASVTTTPSNQPHPQYNPDQFPKGYRRPLVIRVIDNIAELA